MDSEPADTPEVVVSVRESIDPKSSLWGWLAFDLWFHRDRRGLSLAQVARVVRVSRGTVCNWEAGRLRPREEYLRVLDRAWNTGGHFERLHFFARTGHDPDWFKQYIQYEQAAAILKIYHGKTVPALLQTPEYAKALLLAGGQAQTSDREVGARAKRQEVLTRADPPLIWVLLDEDVLDRRIGDQEVMKAQLAHLIEVGKMPHVTVRIVPRSAGAHPGLDGAFQILSLGGRDVAYAGAQIGGRLIETGDETEVLAIQFDQIGAVALSRDDSRKLIEQALESYE